MRAGGRGRGLALTAWRITGRWVMGGRGSARGVRDEKGVGRAGGRGGAMVRDGGRGVVRGRTGSQSPHI